MITSVLSWLHLALNDYICTLQYYNIFVWKWLHLLTMITFTWLDFTLPHNIYICFNIITCMLRWLQLYSFDCIQLWMITFKWFDHIPPRNLYAVHFRRKEITIYPDDTCKPTVGTGLNKKAEVTLDATWPIDKSNRQPIKVHGLYHIPVKCALVKDVTGK